MNGEKYQNKTSHVPWSHYLHRKSFIFTEKKIFIQHAAPSHLSLSIVYCLMWLLYYETDRAQTHTVTHESKHGSPFHTKTLVCLVNVNNFVRLTLEKPAKMLIKKQLNFQQKLVSNWNSKHSHSNTLIHRHTYTFSKTTLCTTKKSKTERVKRACDWFYSKKTSVSWKRATKKNSSEN